MSPEKFVITLDGWTSLGGEFPASAFEHHYLTTADEAFAVVRALTHGDLYSFKGVLPKPNFFDVVALIQRTFTPNVDDVFSREACPLLRKLVAKGLSEDFAPRVSADKSEVLALKTHAESYLFALKVLTFYGHREDGHLIARAARVSAFDDHIMWSSIFDYAVRKNPAAEEIMESLRSPLPQNFCRVAYLDFVNALAFDNHVKVHPFDNDEGCEFLLSSLVCTDPSDDSYAISSIAAAPFLSESRRNELLDRARCHSLKIVRDEARWAEARSKVPSAMEFLMLAAGKPQTATRAGRYLTSLGIPAPMPTNPMEFEALQRASDWLRNEGDFFGQAPDELFLADQRILRWPPSGSDRVASLIGYRHHSDGDQIEGFVTVVGELVARCWEETKPKLLDAYANALRGDPEAYEAHRRQSEDDRFWRKLLAKFNPTVR